jgi:2-polyprenyl-3-methyl-5-hydroxy-6-metoxy-1,4-benzoquinol methylase
VLNQRTFRLLRCLRCGRLVLDPRPTEAELTASYDASYYGEGESKFIGPVEAFVEHFRGVRARQAHRLISSSARAPSSPDASGTRPCVLDIGCGSGQFLARLASLGYDCHGTELSEETARRAAAIPGVRLHVGPMDEKTYPPQSFDLISIWHVLEHLPDADEVVRWCRQWIRPGGFLMIAVPNISSWQAGLFHGAWFHLDPPRHLLHFDPASLHGILCAAGFQMLPVRHLSWEQNLYGYLQSALNAFGFPRDQLYGLFKGSRPTRFPTSLILQVVLAGALLPGAALAAALEAAFGRGGTIECVAVPADGALCTNPQSRETRPGSGT